MAEIIIGTGAAVPDYVLDNDGVAEMVETDDVWIRERTGILQRHIAKEETADSLAEEAACRAMADAGIAPERIDLIVVATTTARVRMPCVACRVQEKIGAKQAVCFDLNAACTGFLLAYQTATAYLKAGIYRTALVIGSDCMSQVIDWGDRSTCILFGDGAGAAVLQRHPGLDYLPVAGADGGRGEVLSCQALYERQPFCKESGKSGFLHMDGQAVFKFAVRKVPEAILEVLELNGLTIEDIDWFVVHQANRRIIESVARHLGVSLERFPVNLQEYGNTSAASIPILLDEMKHSGQLKKGQRLVIAGFGAGLTWGASILDYEQVAGRTANVRFAKGGEKIKMES